MSSQRNYLILTLLRRVQRFVLSRGLQSSLSLLKISLALYQNKKSSVLKDWVGNNFHLIFQNDTHFAGISTLLSRLPGFSGPDPSTTLDKHFLKILAYLEYLSTLKIIYPIRKLYFKFTEISILLFKTTYVNLIQM